MRLGIGVQFNEKHSFAFNIGSVRKSEVSIEEPCENAQGRIVTCSRTKQVISQSAEFLYRIDYGRYYAEVGGVLIASKFNADAPGSFGDGKSGSFSSGFIMDDPSFSKDIAAKLGGGIFFNRRHRVGLFAKTKYGGESVGYFQHIALNYNYQLDSPLQAVKSGIRSIQSVLKPFDLAVKFYGQLPMFYLGKPLSLGTTRFRIRGTVLPAQGLEAEYYFKIPSYEQTELNFSCLAATFAGFAYVIGCGAGVGYHFNNGWFVQFGGGSYVANAVGDESGTMNFNVPTLTIGKLEL